MTKRDRAEQLDQAVAAMLARTSQQPEPGLHPLLQIAAELRDLPRESFKRRLKSELERKITMASQAIQPAWQTATARLRIKNAPAALEFYNKAFGATEISRFEAHGTIVVADVRIGNSVIVISEAAPEWGFPGPEAYGGSPVTMTLRVDDVDAFVERAVAAGARPVEKVADQFYGDRRGSVADPFGYIWAIATRKEELSLEEIYRRFDAQERERQTKISAESPIPKGYHTITPYIVVQDAPALIDFTQQVFGAEETFRAIGGAGGIHAEVRIGDSMVMIGGGGPGLSWRGESQNTALHVYVEHTDAAYERALQAGASSLGEPTDQPYGERGASVKDPLGNFWYLATWKGESHVQPGLRTVTPYLHPRRAVPFIEFLKRGLGAEEVARYASPDGVIHHAQIRIGDSVIEMGEAHGPYQPMPAMFYLYVPDADAMYSGAMSAGAASVFSPADQPYGDRMGAVKDAFGNQWCFSTRIKDVGQGS